MPVGAFVITQINGSNRKIIMSIGSRLGGHLFQRFLHIRNKQWLRIVNHYCHGGVQTLNIDNTVLDSGISYLSRDLIGNIDKVQGGGALKVNQLINNPHSTKFTAKGSF